MPFKAHQVLDERAIISRFPSVKAAAPCEAGKDIMSPKSIYSLKKAVECVGNTDAGMYPHECVGVLTKPDVLSMIRQETTHMLQKDRGVLSPYKKKDVVIHLRCGDLITGDGGGWYGFEKFDFYRRLIPADAGTIYMVGNIAAANQEGNDVQDSDLQPSHWKKCGILRDKMIEYLQSTTNKTVSFIGIDSVKDLSM